MTLLKRLLGGSAIIIGAALIPGLAFATAANTTITNTVTVNYTDAANNAQPQEQASASILVNLVASAPLLSSPADVDPTTENTAVNLIYTITSTANGPDTYNFSSADTPTNMDNDAAFSTPSILLGATTAASGITIGATVITVPYDGTDDNNVNGLVAGDTIVLDPTGVAEVATILSVDESSGAATNTVTITLVAGTTNAFPYGTPIGERANVTVTVTTDDITAGTFGTHSVLTTATSQEDALVATTQATATVINVRRPVLTINKYVRNNTPASPFNTGVVAITVDGVDYYTSGVTGNPGDTMQYLIVIDNSAAGAGVASNIIVTDPVPQFTTYQSNTIELDPGTGNFAAQDDGDTTGAAEFDGTAGIVYVYAGAGGSAGAAGFGNGTGGTLAPGEISYIRFDVEID
ncbi:MAG: hypothetical protein ACK4SX_05305 [Alcanivoracaceae bacterium]